MNYPDKRKNPRFNRTFPVTVNLGDEFCFQGRAAKPSAYGVLWAEGLPAQVDNFI